MTQSNGNSPANAEWSGGAAAMQSPDFSRGTNQSGVRLYNERLALSLIRRHGSLPKAELARLTGLSAQTVSMIIKQLEADGLVLKEKPKRGRIGQPPVPISLNPDGAYSLGLKIGRRSADLMLLDLVGGVRGTTHRTFRYPTPEQTIRLFEEGFDIVTRDLKPAQLSRIYLELHDVSPLASVGLRVRHALLRPTHRQRR